MSWLIGYSLENLLFRPDLGALRPETGSFIHSMSRRSIPARPAHRIRREDRAASQIGDSPAPVRVAARRPVWLDHPA